MKNAKGNKGLLDKKRFEKLEQERRQRLRKLSSKKAIRLAEDKLTNPWSMNGEIILRKISRSVLK